MAEASSQADEWITEIRDLTGYPVKIQQQRGEVILIVARTAPRGRIRLGVSERDAYMQAYAEAERRAEAWEAAQAAGTEDGAIFDTNVGMYCLAHRRRVRWLPAPMWWHHDDLRSCMAMWDDCAPRTSETAGAARTEGTET